MRKGNSASYNHGYYLEHREALLARRREYEVAHTHEITVGRKAYYKGRKALEAVEVETLFDGVQPLLMRRGHRYLQKKREGL